jgi:hypothetical protein
MLVSNSRRPVQIRTLHFKRRISWAWVCSDCAWQFNPSGAPARNDFAEIKLNYEREREKAFESHVCAEHPKETPNSSTGQGLR